MTLLASRLLPSYLSGGPPLLPNSMKTVTAPPYSLGDPGQPSAMPTLLIAVFDDSPSVSGSGSNDPLSSRYAEATHAFDVVSQHGSRRELGAVLHFDTPTSVDVEPVALVPSRLRQLRRGLRHPPGGFGTSELGPSLRRAWQLIKQYPQHRPMLLVLSDFLLLDAEPAQVLSDLAAFPGTVHAVVLGNHPAAGTFADNVLVTHISVDASPGAVARAVFTSLTEHRRPRRASPTA